MARCPKIRLVQTPIFRHISNIFTHHSAKNPWRMKMPKGKRLPKILGQRGNNWVLVKKYFLAKIPISQIPIRKLPMCPIFLVWGDPPSLRPMWYTIENLKQNTNSTKTTMNKRHFSIFSYGIIRLRYI